MNEITGRAKPAANTGAEDPTMPLVIPAVTWRVLTGRLLLDDVIAVEIYAAVRRSLLETPERSHPPQRRER